MGPLSIATLGLSAFNTLYGVLSGGGEEAQGYTPSVGAQDDTYPDLYYQMLLGQLMNFGPQSWLGGGMTGGMNQQQGGY